MSAEKSTRIDIFADIDPFGGVTASAFNEELKASNGGDVELHINSGGGDVFEAFAIMNALRDHPGKVTVVVDGLAASAASFIAVGGADHVVMQESSSLMIHDAVSMWSGNAASFAKTAAELDRHSEAIAQIYASKAGTPVEEWREAMREESWFSADEAVLVGLADEVRSREKVPAGAVAWTRSRVLNSDAVRYRDRADAPTPRLVLRASGTKPNTQKEEPTMAILNEFASMLGMSDKNPSESDVRAALREVLNEQIEVTSVIELTYPEGTTVVPTGKATITPEGEVPAGLVFAVGEAPEGWTVEVDEVTGVVTVTAPSAVEPDTEVQVNVTAQGNGEPVEFPISVTVKSAAGDEEQEPATVDPAADSVTLDRDTFNDLKAAAKLGWEAKNAADKAARVSEVDKWISEGRINTAHRGKAIAAMENDADKARALFGSIPKNTIPRGEAGYGADDDAAVESDVKQRAAKALRTPNLY